MLGVDPGMTRCGIGVVEGAPGRALELVHVEVVRTIAILMALTFIAIGYMVAAFSKNQESASGISSLINFPMMFLSGLFFPVEFVPQFLQPVIAIIPLTYLVDAIRQIMIGTNPLFPMALDVAVLLAWFTVTLVVAVRFFKWE